MLFIHNFGVSIAYKYLGIDHFIMTLIENLQII